MTLDGFDTGATAWVLASSALVLLMTPGVAFLYGGMVRSKNVLSTMMMSFIAMAVVGVCWIALGYSLAFGDANPFFGGLDFAGLSDMGAPVPGFEGDSALAIPPIVFVGFQMMFAVITGALLTGSAAERWRFGSCVVFLAVWSLLVYAPIAHWVFSPHGWAASMGSLDFAGGTVVHCNAGACGLALAFVLGKREPRDADIDGHNKPFVMMGAALLWFGWFGFNAGSALNANELAGYAFVNTNAAACAAMLSWLAMERFVIEGRRATSVGAASGAIAGLVAITPCAGFVGPRSALAVGLLAGGLCALAVHVIGGFVDDAADVAGIHLIGGVVGALSVGLFADRSINPAGRDGLFFGGGIDLLIDQAVVVAAVTAFAFAATLGIAALQEFLSRGARVTDDQETPGLDWSIHGEKPYDFD
ncbi:ammonium transporter [Actinocorallia herbida]|uniref:Ammonium transporter n=1 Tax=Actinocorallia herbida TaxID=58109 RepID=A0A3N1CY75_9ACTN|nr:ammonium transporter [Actinocorallia herbida]ROO86247.1 ammonium transporter [Actinocorallia herbida]